MPVRNEEAQKQTWRELLSPTQSFSRTEHHSVLSIHRVSSREISADQLQLGPLAKVALSG